MPVYATQTDCTNYIEGLTVSDPVAFARLITRAEKDVDSALGAHSRSDVTGLKLAPLELATADRVTLRDATCAQVEYRMTMGEDFFIRPQYAEVDGPEMATKGVLPRVGPKVWSELEGSNLLKLTTSWKGRGFSPPWAPFAYNVGNDFF